MAGPIERTGSSSNQPVLVKVVMLGNGGVGKSTLTLRLMYDDFISEYEPTRADSYRKKINVDGVDVMLDIMDTAGQEEYANIRDNYLFAGDGFILVFSLTERESLRSLQDIREQILRVKSSHTAENIPLILAGNKADLDHQRRIPEEDGKNVGDEWGCQYLETSAKTRQNVENIYYDVVRLVLARMERENQLKNKNKKKGSHDKKRKCTIL